MVPDTCTLLPRCTKVTLPAVTLPRVGTNSATADGPDDGAEAHPANPVVNASTADNPTILPINYTAGLLTALGVLWTGLALYGLYCALRQSRRA